ncbi:RNA polymerase subunit sigma-24 [Wenjunlia vitaminophila]|uniref:RNA polymerase subunit sigma-24 n=2 Tax=Wenjunlia vitaminophila TaxID=76728 RepID=A0A0T6LLH2_WENVI|nr:RNA polymerase subunit sigma-24 [Wenjunlia vitaminophila]
MRTAYLLTGQLASAEDLVQTTLAKAWSVWSRIEDDPDPYVRTVMVNTHRRWWRRLWRGELPTGEFPDRAGHGDAMTAVDERDVLWQALRRLPRGQRTVLVLRYFEDLTEAETARVMGCSVGTVKKQASKALSRLRGDASVMGTAPVKPSVTATRS